MITSKCMYFFEIKRIFVFNLILEKTHEFNCSKGILIPIGGNEDKGTGEDNLHTLDFIDEGILSHVVEAAGGETGKYCSSTYCI